MDALGEALAEIDPSRVKGELTTYVPEDAQRVLAAAGIRDEHVFSTPIILETKPTLLLGLSASPRRTAKKLLSLRYRHESVQKYGRPRCFK